MIGLMFLGAALLWAGLVWWLCKRIPMWLGIQKHPMWFSAVLFPIIASLPFIDHWIGMWQFQKLCDQQTALQIYPNAVNAKRGKGESSSAELLTGYLIPIRQRITSIIDLDTGEVVANFRSFGTYGGRVGPLIMLGGEYTCSIKGAGHIDHSKFMALAAQVNLIYGEAK